MRRLLRHRALVTALAAAATTTCAIAPRAALAQGVDKKQLARQYTNAAIAAQDARDYDTAITFYQKAYEQVPHPILLFNMAQSHRLAGREAEALALYQRYLTDDPKGPKAKDARGFVTELEARVAAARAAEERGRRARRRRARRRRGARGRRARRRRAGRAGHASHR